MLTTVILVVDDVALKMYFDEIFLFLHVEQVAMLLLWCQSCWRSSRNLKTENAFETYGMSLQTRFLTTCWDVVYKLCVKLSGTLSVSPVRWDQEIKRRRVWGYWNGLNWILSFFSTMRNNTVNDAVTTVTTDACSFGSSSCAEVQVNLV